MINRLDLVVQNDFIVDLLFYSLICNAKVKKIGYKKDTLAK